MVVLGLPSTQLAMVSLKSWFGKARRSAVLIYQRYRIDCNDHEIARLCEDNARRCAIITKENEDDGEAAEIIYFISGLFEQQKE